MVNNTTISRGSKSMVATHCCFGFLFPPQLLVNCKIWQTGYLPVALYSTLYSVPEFYQFANFIFCGKSTGWRNFSILINWFTLNLKRFEVIKFIDSNRRAKTKQKKRRIKQRSTDLGGEVSEVDVGGVWVPVIYGSHPDVVWTA